MADVVKLPSQLVEVTAINTENYSVVTQETDTETTIKQITRRNFFSLRNDPTKNIFIDIVNIGAWNLTTAGTWSVSYTAGANKIIAMTATLLDDAGSGGLWINSNFYFTATNGGTSYYCQEDLRWSINGTGITLAMQGHAWVASQGGDVGYTRHTQTPTHFTASNGYTHTQWDSYTTASNRGYLTIIRTL